MLIPLPGRAAVLAAGLPTTTRGRTFVSRRGVAPFTSTDSRRRGAGLLPRAPRGGREHDNGVTAVVSCSHFTSVTRYPVCVHAHAHITVSHYMHQLLAVCVYPETICRPQSPWILWHWRKCLNTQPDITVRGQPVEDYRSDVMTVDWSRKKPITTMVPKTHSVCL